jgi:ribosome-associated protein
MALTDIPGFLVVGSRIRIPLGELEFAYARSSGAGGQHVNRTNSKASLRWRPASSAGLPHDVRERFLAAFASRLTVAGEILIASESHRDQARNVAECVEKLRAMLEQVARPPKARKKTKPTYGSKQRRLASKRADSEKKRGRARKDWD